MRLRVLKYLSQGLIVYLQTPQIGIVQCIHISNTFCSSHLRLFNNVIVQPFSVYSIESDSSRCSVYISVH